MSGWRIKLSLFINYFVFAKFGYKKAMLFALGIICAACIVIPNTPVFFAIKMPYTDILPISFPELKKL